MRHNIGHSSMQGRRTVNTRFLYAVLVQIILQNDNSFSLRKFTFDP